MTRNITDQTILNKKNTDICLFRQFIGVVIFSWLLICIPSTGNLPAPPGTRVAGPFPVPSERPPLLPVSADSGPDPFPRVEGLQPQVAFWRDVFTRYSRQQVLIHDNWYMGIIYEVVDLSQAGENRRAVVQAAVEKWSALLKQASDQWDTPKEMSPEVRVIYRAFSDFPESPRFAKRDALKRLRVQTGQADSFRKGVVWSGRYLPSMKKILSEYELPEKLACMPLIESAFNTGAVSFVGAGGIWQLMPYVGRQYGLKVGGLVDERRDPLIATRAAAQHLSTNFTELESWPLAITAYNHGLGGIKKAADTVGSKDIWQITQNYESPSFGFASRNFYAEFLAALEIFDNPSKYYDGIEPDAPVITARFELPHWVAASALETSCGLPVDLLRDINPALLETAFRPGNFLPAGYALNIPVQQKDTIATAYAAMPDAMKYRYLGGQSLRVRRGQTLGNIARACGVSSGTIARINGLKRNRKLRSGQLLKLPGRYAAIGGNDNPQDTPVVEVAAVRPEKTEVPVKKAVARKKQILKKPVLQAWLKHRVRSGETLLQIARKYGVSPRVIARHNALRDHSNIRIGQVLKIPEG